MKLYFLVFISAIFCSGCSDSKDKGDEQRIQKEKINKDIMKITPTKRPDAENYKSRI